MTIDLTSLGVLLPAPGAPPSPLAWAAPGIVHFVNVAEVTYTPDGHGDGFFWMFAGQVGAKLEPIPVHIDVTEMKEDCTGKFQYTLRSRAGKRIPDMLASDYLRESIMNPNGYVVAGFPAGVMYQSFGNELTEDQINNLVSYLLTFE